VPGHFEDQEMAHGIVVGDSRHVPSRYALARKRREAAKDGRLAPYRGLRIGGSRLLQEIAGTSFLKDLEVAISSRGIVNLEIAGDDAFGVQKPALKEIAYEVSLEQHGLLLGWILS
jgi:hypothetical protein